MFHMLAGVLAKEYQWNAFFSADEKKHESATAKESWTTTAIQKNCTFANSNLKSKSQWKKKKTST